MYQGTYYLLLIINDALQPGCIANVCPLHQIRNVGPYFSFVFVPHAGVATPALPIASDIVQRALTPRELTRPTVYAAAVTHVNGE
tara:strand:- start:697 stop:951 length:255 start_codon:yes stop_codon:yes gene_type:complete